MSRFVVRFKGDGGKPEDLIARIKEFAPAARVVDETSKMLLLDGPDWSESAIRENMPELLVVPQQHFSLPKPPIPKIKKAETGA